MKQNNKIVYLSSLKRIVGRLRRQGKKIAFTNGCFDLLHFGHIYYLQKAKGKDRILIVGINSDSSVKKIKGKGRPIVPQRIRAAVVSALQCVDYVTIFSGSTPYHAIKVVKPDVLIKGADWKDKGVVGRDIVEERGGKVELIRYMRGYSTTEVIQSISKNA